MNTISNAEPERPRKTMDDYNREFNEAVIEILARLADDLDEADRKHGVKHDYSMLRKRKEA
jgi:hypothetical protein